MAAMAAAAVAARIATSAGIATATDETKVARNTGSRVHSRSFAASVRHVSAQSGITRRAARAAMAIDASRGWPSS